RTNVDNDPKSAYKRITKLVKDRAALKDHFPNAIAAIARYEFICTRLPGRVIVPARDGACTGCHMMAPPQVYNELQIGDKVIQCPSCKRILYYEEQAAE